MRGTLRDMTFEGDYPELLTVLSTRVPAPHPPLPYPCLFE
jgi:hypothetical protein